MKSRLRARVWDEFLMSCGARGGGALICSLSFANRTSNNFVAVSLRCEAVPLLSQHLCNRGKLHLHVPSFLLCCLSDIIG